MCGRFTQIMSWSELVALYHINDDTPQNTRARYNVSPTQDVPLARNGDDGREMAPCSWGLVPFWAKDTKIAFKTINARSETIAVKPSFRAAFKSRRCLIPADGYYEWTKTPDGKQPHRICLSDEGPMSFAGLWERNEKFEMESFTIVTTSAAPSIEHVHSRMPVILEEDAYDAWLSEDTATDDALAMLQPYSGKLITYPVSRYVSNSRNEGPECIERVEQ